MSNLFRFTGFTNRITIDTIKLPFAMQMMYKDLESEQQKKQTKFVWLTEILLQNKKDITILYEQSYSSTSRYNYNHSNSYNALWRYDSKNNRQSLYVISSQNNVPKYHPEQHEKDF